MKKESKEIIENIQFENLTVMEDKLLFLLDFGIHAPSSHNSQPWKFRIRKNAIEIVPNMYQVLSKSDKNNRQLYISLGCVVENIVLAGIQHGLSTSVEYVGGKGVAARLVLSENENEDTERQILARYIKERSTIRGEYEKRMPEAEYLQWIEEYTRQNDIDTFFISDSEQKEKVAHIVIDATLEAMGDTDFRHELSEYLLTPNSTSKVGMPAVGFGIPTLLAYVAPFMLRHFNMNKLSKAKDLDLLISHTPMYIVLATSSDNPKSWLAIGRAYQHIALEAVKRKIQTAPMAAPIQIGEHYLNLKEVLNAKGRPQFFFRVGYSEARGIKSPRIPVKKCLIL